ncbi:hypothetical protein FRX31_013367 [Thalictrum thalictroides]|uniref:Uncharacterized protein n=1 Tax=Thalictrum thalictroides TaxID=46969 RepID=A0A7J6WJF5_THATH|nr:hypothetical protein FRX31_013367 [Thalictrum thalictroides]
METLVPCSEGDALTEKNAKCDEHVVDTLVPCSEGDALTEKRIQTDYILNKSDEYHKILGRHRCNLDHYQ